VAAPEPKVDLREAEIALERKKPSWKEEKRKRQRKNAASRNRRNARKKSANWRNRSRKRKKKPRSWKKRRLDKLKKAKLEKEKEKRKKKAEGTGGQESRGGESRQGEKAAEEKKAADKARAAEMSRITGAVGTGRGTAAKATAPRKDSGYVAALTSKIKGNLAYSGSTDVPGNPRAVFKIEQLPTGEIISSER
jgi:colicin import membrane protein